MKRIFPLAFILILSIAGFAQNTNYKCYPTHWWAGMKWNKLQIMVHGDKIAENFPMIKMGPKGMSLAKGVNLVKINLVENPNYVFLDLVIDPTAKPGKFSFPFVKNMKLEYELKPRRKGNGTEYAQGVNSGDFIYLLMPDRFSDGDPSNDRFAGMLDTVIDRKNVNLRHGGDLQGVLNHLDYLKELGVTSIWLTPVVNNDMPLEIEPPGPVSGYHGYWMTEHYEVDKRFGGNQAYRDLVDASHKKGIKIIHDAVYNHVGEKHWFITDPPMKDWINHWPVYQGTHHREEIFIDPHAAQVDKDIMIKGWFVPHLPDLNLANPYLANYFIQNTIWTTEEFGIDGWRVDTYKYNDEQFLVRINKALADEYPSLTGFGEVTSNTVIASAYFTKNNMITPIKHNILGITDYPLYNAMLAGLNEPFGWTNGFNKLYMTLAQDILYKDPSYNCIFLDNHDQDRVLSVINEDYDKYKMGINWLLTLRGIPQLYYGTEILMKNTKNPSDGLVRMDFPGGWKDDKENKFTAAGRTVKENDAFNYVKTLAAFRAGSTALKTGKLMQYIPQKGLYTYFRYDKNQTVMVVSNSNDTAFLITVNRFFERTKGFTKKRNIMNGNISALTDFSLAARQSEVYELLK
ncbi:glycoside hydrolase family 13 protein [soil metagenome]